MYVGHLVSKDGVRCSPIIWIEAVQKYPVPTNHKELQQFLGLTSFFRKFVDGFARIAQPLYSLLGGSSKKSKNRQSTRKWEWIDVHQNAFDFFDRNFFHPHCYPIQTLTSPSYSEQMHQRLVSEQFCVKSRMVRLE